MERKPDWLKVKINSTGNLNTVKHLLHDLNLNTVCEAANCPNRLECFSSKTATFMILGTICTRHCKFCNVTDGQTMPLDLDEPRRLAEAIKKLGLKHAVITSVTRDDLDDQGASHFANCIHEIKTLNPEVSVEVLTPDFSGDLKLIKKVVDAKPDVYNHNIESVKALYHQVRPEATYQQSIQLLKDVKKLDPKMITKSGIMVGLGESQEQVVETMKDLRDAGCDLLTIGQYLPPSKEHYPLKDYIHPDIFKYYEDTARQLGFKGVAASPLVRSSYKALETYKEV